MPPAPDFMFDRLDAADQAETHPPPRRDRSRSIPGIFYGFRGSSSTGSAASPTRIYSRRHGAGQRDRKCALRSLGLHTSTIRTVAERGADAGPSVSIARCGANALIAAQTNRLRRSDILLPVAFLPKLDVRPTFQRQTYASTEL